MPIDAPGSMKEAVLPTAGARVCSPCRCLCCAQGRGEGAVVGKHLVRWATSS